MPKTAKNQLSLGDPLTRTALGSVERKIHINSFLRLELLIFSGQLYLDSMDNYRDFQIFFKGFLGNRNDEDRTDVSFRNSRIYNIETDSNLQEQYRRRAFLRRVLEIRNDSTDIDKTHMGRICLGEDLEEEDFGGEGQSGNGVVDGEGRAGEEVSEGGERVGEEVVEGKRKAGEEGVGSKPPHKKLKL